MIIIANKEDRDKAVKALQYINSQDKNKIREGISIVHDMLHNIANSPVIIREINNAAKISRGRSYHAPYFELNDSYAALSTGSINGDILTTIAEFIEMVDTDIPVYDNRSGAQNNDTEEDEYDEYDNEEDEDDEESF